MNRSQQAEQARQREKLLKEKFSPQELKELREYDLKTLKSFQAADRLRMADKEVLPQ
jgi:hypothetical protein